MLKFGNFQVFFKHIPDEAGTAVFSNRTGMQFVNHYRGRTMCIITENDEEISSGEAFCSQNDHYDKSIGRKVALTRALAQLDDKEFSTVVWKRYLGTEKKRK